MVIKVSERELQQAIRQKFPCEKNIPVARFSVSDSQVRLAENPIEQREVGKLGMALRSPGDRDRLGGDGLA